MPVARALTTGHDLAHRRRCVLFSFGLSQHLGSSVFCLPYARGAQARRLYIRSDKVAKEDEEKGDLLSRRQKKAKSWTHISTMLVDQNWSGRDINGGDRVE